MHHFGTESDALANAAENSNEKVIVGNINHVRVFLSQRAANQPPKWIDTQALGVLKLVEVGNVGVPIIVIRLVGCDPVGNEKAIVMQYELPLNFRFLPDLTSTFMALHVTKN